LKKYLFTGLLLLFVSSILFTGCGALIALVSSIFGSQGGFLFIPFLGDGKIESSQTGKIPGMIMLFTNNPPSGYRALSGATVTITGVSSTTNSDGSFNITGIPVGIGRFTAEHPSYISITQDVPVADPNATGSTFTDFNVLGDGAVIPVGGTVQCMSYATSSNNSIITPPTTWSVTGDIGTIGASTGIFTATKGGTGLIKGVSGGGSKEVRVTVVNGTGTIYGKVIYNNQPVSHATVYVEAYNQYVYTDSDGHYNMPGVPAANIKVIGFVDYDTQNNTQGTPPQGKLETSGITKLVGTTTVNLGPNETKEANIVLLGAGNLTPVEGTPTAFPTQGTQTPTATPTATPTQTQTATPTINPSAPTITSVAQSGMEIRINGTNFGASTGTVTFNGTGIMVHSWLNGTDIWTDQPSVAGTYQVIVITSGGISSAPYSFTYTP
jgi:hypothetical protein